MGKLNFYLISHSPSLLSYYLIVCLFQSEPEDLPDLVDPASSDTSRNNSDDDCVPDLVEMGTSEDSDDSDDEDSEVRI